MITALIAKFVLGGGGLAIIYGFYLRYRKALDTIADMQTKEGLKNDLDKIAELAKITEEKSIDFNDAISKFESNNPGVQK